MILAGSKLENRLYILDDGFAFDFATLPGGKRHIFDFYGPGAICNWPRPGRDDTPENILFKAGSEVCVLDQARVNSALARRPELAEMLHQHEIRRAMRVSQRVRALISLPAMENLRIVLLDMADEFGITHGHDGECPLPLTQEELGDLIGSTSVHVSRTLATMEKSGEIERDGTSLCLREIEELREQMAYRRFADPVPDLRSPAHG